MKRHRAIKGVLGNFLGTYTSRYSDYDGYWVFGLLFDSIETLMIDLLSSKNPATESAPMAAAIEIARRKFLEQMSKAGVEQSFIREARLEISKLPQQLSGFVNERTCFGNNVKFVVTVVLDSGKTCESNAVVFVAPHNPKVERQSTRANS